MAVAAPCEPTKRNPSLSIPDNFGWCSGDNRVLRNVPIHDAARANYGPTTYPARRQDHAGGADQHVIADNDPVRVDFRLIDNEPITIADLFRSPDDRAIGRETNMIANDNIALARREMVKTADCALQAKPDGAPA
jgi:hypothetical protein